MASANQEIKIGFTLHKSMKQARGIMLQIASNNAKIKTCLETIDVLTARLVEMGVNEEGKRK